MKRPCFAEKPSLLRKPDIYEYEEPLTETSELSELSELQSPPKPSLQPSSQPSLELSVANVNTNREIVSTLPQDLYEPNYTIYQNMSDLGMKHIVMAYQTMQNTPQTESQKLDEEPSVYGEFAYVASIYLKAAAQAESIPNEIIEEAFADSSGWVAVKRPVTTEKIVDTLLDMLRSLIDRHRQVLRTNQPITSIMQQTLALCDAQDTKYLKNTTKLQHYHSLREERVALLFNERTLDIGHASVPDMNIEAALQRCLKVCLALTKESLSQTLGQDPDITIRGVPAVLRQHRTNCNEWLVYYMLRDMVFNVSQFKANILKSMLSQEMVPPFKEVFGRFINIRKRIAVSDISYDTYYKYEQLEEAILIMELEQLILSRYSTTPLPTASAIPEASVVVNAQVAPQSNLGVTNSVVTNQSSRSNNAYRKRKMQIDPSDATTKVTLNDLMRASTEGSALAETAKTMIREVLRIMRTEPFELKQKLDVPDSFRELLKSTLGSRNVSRATTVTYRILLEIENPNNMDQDGQVHATSSMVPTLVKCMIDKLCTQNDTLQHMLAQYSTAAKVDQTGQDKSFKSSDSSDGTQTTQTIVATLDALQLATEHCKELQTKLHEVRQRVIANASNVSKSAIRATIQSNMTMSNSSKVDVSEESQASSVPATVKNVEAIYQQALLSPELETRSKYMQTVRSKMKGELIPLIGCLTKEFTTMPSYDEFRNASSQEAAFITERFNRHCDNLLNAVKGPNSIVGLSKQLGWMHSVFPERRLTVLIRMCSNAIMATANAYRLPVDPQIQEAIALFSTDDVDMNKVLEAHKLMDKDVEVISVQKIEKELAEAEQSLIELDKGLDERAKQLAELRDQINWLLGGLEELETRAKFYDWNTNDNELSPSQRINLILSPLRALKTSIGHTVHGRMELLDFDNLAAQLHQARQRFREMCEAHLTRVQDQIHLARQHASRLCDETFGTGAYKKYKSTIYESMNQLLRTPELKTEMLLRQRFILNNKLNEMTQIFENKNLPYYYYAPLHMAVKTLLTGTRSFKLTEIHPPPHPYVETQREFQDSVSHIVTQLCMTVDTLVHKAKQPILGTGSVERSSVQEAYNSRNTLRVQYSKVTRFYERVDAIVAELFDDNADTSKADNNETSEEISEEVSCFQLDTLRTMHEAVDMALNRLQTSFPQNATIQSPERATRFLTKVVEAYKSIIGVVVDQSTSNEAETRQDVSTKPSDEMDEYYHRIEAVRTSSKTQKMTRLTLMKDEFAVMLTSYRNAVQTRIFNVLFPATGAAKRKQSTAQPSIELMQGLLEDAEQVAVMLVDLYQDLIMQYVDGVYNIHSGDAMERRLMLKMGLLEARPFFDGTRVLQRDVTQDVAYFRSSQTFSMEAVRRNELPYLSPDAPEFSLNPFMIDSSVLSDLGSFLQMQVLTQDPSGALRRCYDAINRISTLANLVSLTRLRIEAGVRFRSPEVVLNAMHTAFEYANEALFVGEFVQDTVYKICTTLWRSSSTAESTNVGTSQQWDARLKHYGQILQRSRQNLPTSAVLHEEFQMLETLYERAVAQSQMDSLEDVPLATDDVTFKDVKDESAAVGAVGVVGAVGAVGAVGVDAISMDLTSDSATPNNLFNRSNACAEAQDESDAYRSSRLFDEWASIHLEDSLPIVENIMSKFEGVAHAAYIDRLRARLRQDETRRLQILKKERACADDHLLIAWRDQFENVSERLLLNALESTLGASQNAHSCLLILLYSILSMDTAQLNQLNQLNLGAQVEAIDRLYTGKLAAFVAFERDIDAYELRVSQAAAFDGADFSELAKMRSYASAAALLQRQDLARMLQTEIDQGVDQSNTLEDMGLPSMLLDARTKSMIDANQFDKLLESEDTMEEALQTTTLLADLVQSFPSIQALVQDQQGVVTDKRTPEGAPLTSEIRSECMQVLSDLRQAEFVLARISTQESFDMQSMLPYMNEPLLDLIDQIASIDMVRWRYRDESNYLIQQSRIIQQRMMLDMSETKSTEEDVAPTLNGLVSPKAISPISRSAYDEWLLEGDEPMELMEGDQTSTNLVAHPKGAMDAAAGVIYPNGNAHNHDKYVDNFFGIGEEDTSQTPLTERMSRILSAGVAGMLETSMKMHITPIAALTEYFNTANTLLRGDDRYNYMARTCRPLFSPIRAGCLHAASLEEAIQIAFIYAFLYNEAQLWKQNKLANTRQDEEIDEEDDENDEEDRQNMSDEYKQEFDMDREDFGDVDRNNSNDAREVDDLTDLGDGQDMPSFLASCYNVEALLQQSTRIDQRIDVAELFAAFDDMTTNNRIERRAGVTRQLGKLPVDLLSARAPVRFAMPVKRSSSSETPDKYDKSTTEVAIVEVQTVIPPVAQVPIDVPFDLFKVNFAVNVSIKKELVKEADLAYFTKVKQMFDTSSVACAHFPPESTLCMPISTSDSMPERTNQSMQASLNKAITVYATSPMSVGGAVVNALLNEDMDDVPLKMRYLFGSIEQLTTMAIDLDEAKTKIQSFIQKQRKAFSMPNTYDGSDASYANLTPFKRTAEPIRAASYSYYMDASTEEERSNISDPTEIVVRLKNARISPSMPSYQDGATAASAATPNQRMNAASFAADALEPLRRELEDAITPQNKQLVLKLKNELRVACVMQTFWQLRSTAMRSYLRQAALHGRCLQSAKVRSISNNGFETDDSPYTSSWKERYAANVFATPGSFLKMRSRKK